MDQSEIEEKQRRLRDMLGARGLDAVLLTDPANVAWLSGGARTYINIASESGVGSLFVTPDTAYLLTDQIEAARLAEEEGFEQGGWDIIVEPWYEPQTRFAELSKGLRVGADRAGEGLTNISGDVARLRWHLTPEEVERYRALGADSGAAIAEAARAVRPGMAEHEIAGLLAQETYRRGAVPIVVLVATDERIQKRRHPLPVDKSLERTAMLVLCARRQGLIVSTTRLVHFGPLPEELRRGMQAVATIDATAVLATRPGVTANSIFARIQDAYAEVGYPGEWRNHHQGGAAGYAAREYVATPYTDYPVEQVQAFAWNPSVPGAKSEDTFLITEAGPELLSPSPDWPQQQVVVDGVTMERPDVLQM